MINMADVEITISHQFSLQVYFLNVYFIYRLLFNKFVIVEITISHQFSLQVYFLNVYFIYRLLFNKFVI